MAYPASLRSWQGMLAALAMSVAACLPAVATAGGNAAARIVIDPGHTPAQGGALGVRAIHEVRYNDRLASQVVQALTQAGFDASLTRRPDEKISLEERARISNARRADLFLSIHHDSAQLQYLEKFTLAGQEAYRTTRPIAGYSVFVSKRNPRFTQSHAFAQLLGEEMRKLGRPPTLHHAEPIAGESRELLAPAIGVYRFDDLVVLRQTEMPAVLLEAGVIVDPVDEAYVNDHHHQADIAREVVAAVRRYVATLSARP
ncbi:N-acetylmuramoyl-L-alanine amidase [Acidovorax sp. Be4]|uniref:N-acetylmuramoyl-L-alanine amidase n=1 Tax=Acidovorax bellezanensis TaxID=2976702 RepID=A0ABT2PJM5_9BURK|nr:N-acetylmuramoyl-L-alanine amidase [Acidovorax sp. Be4]MCT9810686.1 N-acetylmuramoyl-L-alanine amidase [Acidovorax sp. Be4]